MAKIISRKSIRTRLHARIRNKIEGTTERPRLAVSFSHQHIRAQVIDDSTGQTLVAVQTTEKSLTGQSCKPNLKGAEAVGKLVAERAIAKKVTKVVFDRGGFTYHGKVKALAEAARAGGLEF
jgi:large subunit ribosomal protein L18